MAAGDAPSGEPDAHPRVATERNRLVPVAKPGELAPLDLGRLRIWPPVVLAPMAGVTNYPFRSLCREFGAGLFVSEMITARGYLLGNRLTKLLVSSREDGTDPVDVGEMARDLAGRGVEHIDLNFGCPVPKVTRAGGGSAVPVKPRLLARILRAAVHGAGKVPVTIKIRTGIDESLLTFHDAGRVAQEEGAAGVGLHARTAADLYAGEADWSAIGELAAAISIPVLGNGDVWEAWDALRMMRETGCAGVIVGRGCLGRPWLFAELAAAFEGREPDPPPNLGRVAEILIDHVRRLVDFFGEAAGLRQARKWCAWYTVGFRGSSRARARLVRVTSIDEIREILAELDPEEPFPAAGLRAHRAKGGRRQRVALPEGYLDDREDDTPPKGPRTPEEIRAWERALSGG